MGFVRNEKVSLYRVRGPRPLMAGVRQPRKNNEKGLTSSTLSGFHPLYSPFSCALWGCHLLARLNSINPAAYGRWHPSSSRVRFANTCISRAYEARCLLLSAITTSAKSLCKRKCFRKEQRRAATTVFALHCSRYKSQRKVAFPS